MIQKNYAGFGFVAHILPEPKTRWAAQLDKSYRNRLPTRLHGGCGSQLGPTLLTDSGRGLVNGSMVKIVLDSKPADLAETISKITQQKETQPFGWDYVREASDDFPIASICNFILAHPSRFCLVQESDLCCLFSIAYSRPMGLAILTCRSYLEGAWQPR